MSFGLRKISNWGFSCAAWAGHLSINSSPNDIKIYYDIVLILIWNYFLEIIIELDNGLSNKCCNLKKFYFIIILYYNKL